MQDIWGAKTQEGGVGLAQSLAETASIRVWEEFPGNEDS